jgi:hypothetical protein
MAGQVNLFGGLAADVIRVLLVNYPKGWALRELAGEAGVSLGWASKVANALIRERLAARARKKAELMLMAPADLLRRWASYRNFAANTRFLEYYAQTEDISKFLDLFKSKKGPDYAVTCLAGALKAAPCVRPTNVHIYVKSDGDAKKWAGVLGLMPIEENGNVKFAAADDFGVFYGARKIDGICVVSDIQLYVDLLNYPGRGEEAAEAVLKVIEKRWKKTKG